MDKKKPVAQYTLDGKLVRVFESLREASVCMTGGLSGRCGIKNSCTGDFSSAYGFRWLFASDMNRACELFSERRIKRTWKNPYTYEECYSEAMKYDRLSDFRTNSNGHYSKAVNNGWLKDYTWLERSEKRVAQYTIEGEFIGLHENANEAAIAIGKNRNYGGGILDVCKGKRSFAHGYRWLFERDMNRAEELFKQRQINRSTLTRINPHSEEEILTEAAKYPTLNMFKKKAHGYYTSAKNTGIIDKLPFEKVGNPFKDEVYYVYVYEFMETNSAYIGITCRKKTRDKQHRSEKGSAVWRHANRNGLKIPEPKYLAENVTQAKAKEMERDCVDQYKKEGWNVLNKAKTGGVGSCNAKYTDEKINKCIEQCSTRIEFRKKFGAIYSCMVNRGLLGMLDCLERTVAPAGTYDEEWCFYTALQYDTVKDFMHNEPTIYSISNKNGWYKSYSWLKSEHRGVYISNPVKVLEDWEIKVFGTMRSCFRYLGVSGCDFKTLNTRCVNRGLDLYSL